MKDEFVKNIGVWGQRHYAYLKKHSPTVINVMRMKGTLEQYLRGIDRDAQDMFELLMKQYRQKSRQRFPCLQKVRKVQMMNFNSLI